MSGVIELSCGVCRDPIAGTYRTNMWGFAFHSHHPTCKVCERPSGRLVSGLGECCVASTVDDLTSAHAVGQRVRHRLEQGRGISSSLTIDVWLSNGLAADKLGIAHLEEVTVGDRRSVSAGIELAAGMPVIQCAAVAAHELVHCWLWEHNVRPAQMVNEGVAELTAFWLLGHLGGSMAAALQYRIAHNPSAVYGAGYRVARAADERHGWPTVRQHLLDHAALPEGDVDIERTTA